MGEGGCSPSKHKPAHITSCPQPLDLTPLQHGTRVHTHTILCHCVGQIHIKDLEMTENTAHHFAEQWDFVEDLPLPAPPDALSTDTHKEHAVLSRSLCCNHLGTVLPRPVPLSKKQPSLLLWLFLHEVNHYKAKEFHLRRNAVCCQLSCFLSHKG